ncbi:hypothetical protein EWI61_04875 [Methylolobus aquaticus]|nr:hypothetical protein EWI61_04875 [Methylolobus aquaticus]
MIPEILPAIVLVSLVQSVFGVGMLLLGIPVLLLLGLDFVQTLWVLLPASLTINLLQLVKAPGEIDGRFYRRLLLFSLPPIILSLALVIQIRLNFALLIGTFLLLLTLKEALPPFQAAFDRLMQHEKTYFLLTGIVHGSSGLGGLLLTAAIHHKQYGKDMARVNAAAGYAAFALIQMATLLALKPSHIGISYADCGIGAATAGLVFLLVDEMLFIHLDPASYRQGFTWFLGLSAVFLIIKGVAA